MKDIEELETAIASPSTPEALKEQFRQEAARLKKAEEERIAAENKAAEYAEKRKLEKERAEIAASKKELLERIAKRKQTQE